MQAQTVLRPKLPVPVLLQVQLAGNAYYFGKLYEKPTIGDPIRPVEVQDISRANRLMLCCDLLCLMLGVMVRGFLLLII